MATKLPAAKKTTPAKKAAPAAKKAAPRAKAVAPASPLQHLMEMSQAALNEFEKRWRAAQDQAAKGLADLEKQRAKAQEQLAAARAKLEAAAAEGRAKAIAKGKEAVAQFETRLAEVKKMHEGNVAQFEALTGYMTTNCSVFLTFDPATGRLDPIGDGPGETAAPDRRP